MFSFFFNNILQLKKKNTKSIIYLITTIDIAECCVIYTSPGETWGNVSNELIF